MIQVWKLPWANILIVKTGEDAVSNQAANLDAVAPCSHEEADTYFPSCPACSKTRTQIPDDQSQGHRHCNHSHISYALFDATWENAGDFWQRREDKMDPNTWGGFSHRTRENTWYPFLPCLQWLSHCFILPWQIKEVCLENVPLCDLQALERFVVLMQWFSNCVVVLLCNSSNQRGVWISSYWYTQQQVQQ